ncbi:MAG: hypothetical protein AAGD96_31330, partial [Chloroflexota bacterium]
EYLGLMSTTEADGTIVSAKMFFTISAFDHHKEAKSQDYSLEELNSDESAKLDKIRNRIVFKLEEDLFGENGQKIEQDEISRIIDRYVVDNNKIKISTKDGKPFNPADDKHYTFNSALILKE